MKISPQQARILAYVREYREVHGFGPSQREIAAWCNVTHQTIGAHVAAMLRKGLVEMTVGVHRSIRGTAKRQNCESAAIG